MFQLRIRYAIQPAAPGSPAGTPIIQEQLEAGPFTWAEAQARRVDLFSGGVQVGQTAYPVVLVTAEDLEGLKKSKR